MAKRDYYDVLGIGRSASDAQIKSAYRKLARKHHPDVSKAPDAGKKFREATEAYEVLSDPQKRKMYDQFGHSGPGRSPFGDGRVRGAPGGFDFDIGDIFGRGTSGFSGMGLDDILNALRGGRGGRRGPKPKGSNVEYRLDLDFMQAVRGTSVTLRYLQPGKAGPAETLNVKVPPGVNDGSRIRIAGRGAIGPGGAGDLHLVAHVGSHPYFRRDGNDIHMDLPISILEATLGGAVDVPTIDGMTSVKIPPGAGGGKKLRLKGKGVSRPGESRGDQYVVLKVIPPEKVSKRGRKLLEEFDSIEKTDVRANAPWKT